MMFTYSQTFYSSIHGCIKNQHNNQLPVGLLAQWEEHCTGIAKVLSSNPVQGLRLFFFFFFSGLIFITAKTAFISISTSIVHKYDFNTFKVKNVCVYISFSWRGHRNLQFVVSCWLTSSCNDVISWPKNSFPSFPWTFLWWPKHRGVCGRNWRYSTH